MNPTKPTLDYASPAPAAPKVKKPQSIRPPGPLFGVFILILFGMLLLIVLVLIVMMFA